MSQKPRTAAADGVLESGGGTYVLRFERHLAHPIERVWAAISDPAELIAWLADGEVELVDGGRIVLRWLNTDDEGNHAVMDARITQLRPPTLLEYEGEPHGRLRWELHPEGDGTMLRFTATTTAPDDQITLALAGWHWHLDALADALDGRHVDWPHWPRDEWEKLYQHYIALLG